jgi:uncharacterized membrane protein
MNTRLNLQQINKQMDLEKIKKENPSLYASIVEKNKKANKIVRK